MEKIHQSQPRTMTLHQDSWWILDNTLHFLATDAPRSKMCEEFSAQHIVLWVVGIDVTKRKRADQEQLHPTTIAHRLELLPCALHCACMRCVSNQDGTEVVVEIAPASMRTHLSQIIHTFGLQMYKV